MDKQTRAAAVILAATLALLAIATLAIPHLDAGRPAALDNDTNQQHGPGYHRPH